MRLKKIDFKIFIAFLSLSLVITNLPIEAKKTYKAQASIQDTKGTKIKLIPETLVDTSLSMEGDFFSALLSKTSAELLQVPQGSRLTGQITKIQKPKNFGRAAKLEAQVDRLVLNDGSSIKVSAKFSSKSNWQNQEQPSAVKNTGKKIAQSTAKVSTSAAVGAVDAIQYTGIGTTIATAGLNTIIGAGLGLGAGLIGLSQEKGKELISSNFNPVNFQLESDFLFHEELPLMQEKLRPVSSSLLGINLEVDQINKLYSKDFGEFMVLEIAVDNQSPEKLFLGDFVLSSDMHIVPVLNNPLISKSGLGSVELKSKESLKLAFSLGKINKNHNYQLMLLDPINQEIIANTDIDIKALI